MDSLIAYGSEVKALDNGKLGGYLVLFGDKNTPDLEGDFFTKDTNFGPHSKTLVWYDHCFDPVMSDRLLDSEATLQVKDAGVWVEAQLKMRDEYEKAIFEMAQANVLGWSSGTASHLVRRTSVEKAKSIDSWPLGLDASITPCPAEPRTRVFPIKSADFKGQMVALTESSIVDTLKFNATKRNAVINAGGKTLADQTTETIEAVKAWLSRLRDVHKLRIVDGRTLSAKTLAQVDELSKELLEFLTSTQVPSVKELLTIEADALKLMTEVYS